MSNEYICLKINAAISLSSYLSPSLSSCLPPPSLAPNPSHNNVRTYQRGFTQQFTSSDQVAYSHMEVSVTTAPVGYLCEWMCSHYLLKNNYITKLNNCGGELQIAVADYMQ